MPSGIRPGREEDYALLPALEDAADAVYDTLPGFDDLTDNDNVTSAAVTDRPPGAGLFMAEDDGQPVGFVYFDLVDDCLFIEQIAVIPKAQGRGFGKALLEAVRQEAVYRGCAGVTLCTYRHVPWNLPYYAKHGYRALAPEEMGPELAAHFAEDVRRWSRYGERVAMGWFSDR